MMLEKKVITWKAADQLLCEIAAYMLQEASQHVRSNAEQRQAWPVMGGGTAEPGIGEDDSKRTMWSGVNPFHENEDWFDSAAAQAWEENDRMSAICWWSFHNMIRMRLKDARQELVEALYTQDRAARVSKQRTRNPNGRADGSRFGWQGD